MDALRGENDPQEYRTLQEKVYRELRMAIITGKFMPDRAVTIRGLAEMLGTSPMPVREALRRLVAEHALTLLPNRRVTVPGMTGEKFAELTEARVALETLAAERSVPFITDDLVEKLRKLDDEVDSAISVGDIERYMRNNMQFHFSLYNAGPNGTIIPLIESLWLQIGPFLHLAMNHFGVDYAADHHKETLRALEERNGPALRHAIEGDIRDGMGSIPATELKAEGA